MKLTIKQQFIRFLKENNAYEEYIHNFNNRKEEDNKVCPKNKFFSKTEPLDFIDSAFNWSNSHEHFLFWENLNGKWIDYIITLYNEINT